MKNLTLLFVTYLLYGSVVFGQSTIGIHGILNTTNGDPAANIPVKIELFTRGITPTETWNVSTDDNGRFSVTAEIDRQVRFARVRVTFTNCDGKTIQKIKPWTSGMSDVVFDLLYCEYNTSDSCSVVIIPSRLSNISDSLLLRTRATGQRPITFEWSTGETTPSISVEPDQEYCVTITDANGCMASACWSPPELECEVNITLLIKNDGNYLVADFTPEEDSIAYTWSNGSNNDTIKVDSAGRYCVSAVDSINNCTATKCFYFDPDSIDCFVAELNLHPFGTDSFDLTVDHVDSLELEYIWSTGDSTATIGVNSSGLYSVTITDKNNALCQVEFNQLVILEEDCFAEIFGKRIGNIYRLFVQPGINIAPDSIIWSNGGTGPSIIVRAQNSAEYCVDVYIGNCIARACYTVDGDDFNDSESQLLKHLGQTDKEEFSVSPNPVSDEIRLSFGEFSPSVIQIFNNSGTLVHSLRLNNDVSTHTLTIQASNLPSGLYFMNIVGKGQSNMLKFVKQ